MSDLMRLWVLESFNYKVNLNMTHIAHGRYSININDDYNTIKYFKIETYTNSVNYRYKINNIPTNMYSIYNRICGDIDHYMIPRPINNDNVLQILMSYRANAHDNPELLIFKVKFRNQSDMDSYQLPEPYLNHIVSEITPSEFNPEIVSWMIGYTNQIPDIIKVDGNFIGTALSGTATSDPSWAIMKVSDDGILYPDGLTDRMFIWDNRSSYNYK